VSRVTRNAEWDARHDSWYESQIDQARIGRAADSSSQLPYHTTSSN